MSAAGMRTGIELVATARFASLAETGAGPDFMEFTAEEHAAVKALRDKTAAYAELFAAKAAVARALGDARITGRSVAIRRDPSGRPFPLVNGLRRPGLEVSWSSAGTGFIAAVAIAPT